MEAEASYRAASKQEGGRAVVAAGPTAEGDTAADKYSEESEAGRGREGRTAWAAPQESSSSAEQSHSRGRMKSRTEPEAVFERQKEVDIAVAAVWDMRAEEADVAG